MQELQELVGRMHPRIPLCSRAIRTLFYFMRCSQLEYGEQGGSVVQELCYERAYVVLPPLVEWLRVAVAHGEHRHAAVLGIHIAYEMQDWYSLKMNLIELEVSLVHL